MLNQIKSLLSDAQLQQKIDQATNQPEAIRLIVAAGAARGYEFSKEAVSQTLTTLVSMKSNELSEEDLLAVSGGPCPHSRCHSYCGPCPRPN